MSRFAAISVLILFGLTRTIASKADTLAVVDVPDSMYRVDNVIVLGNESTKSFVVEREMSLKPGSVITQRTIAYDTERIYSLQLFNRVEIRVLPTSPHTATLAIVVSERWYIFPFPILGIRDQDWNRWYYGAGVLHSNFRGRNERFYSMFALGADPFVAIGYRNPFLSEDGNFFLDSRISYTNSRNQSLTAQHDGANFDERHYAGSVSLGRRFGNYRTLAVSIGYEVAQIPTQPGSLRTITPDGTDRFPTFSVSFAHDTRDLVEYAWKGALVRGSVAKLGFPSGSSIDITRFAVDARVHVPIGSVASFAARSFGNIVSGGLTPSHNRVYFGYSERIRGYYKTVREGENIFGASTELRLMLLEPSYVRVKFLPEAFGMWRLALAAAIFADAGTVWFRGDLLAITAVRRGYGAGLHFLLPYSIVLRTEYAINELRRGQFIVAIGAAI
jgi:outer membrane protein assembly factor BamA